jgi:acyl dehydratase
MGNDSPYPDGWSETRKGQPTNGSSAERSKVVTDADLKLFAEITGDRNPLHFDAELARGSVFAGLIAHGGVTSGILNALVAEDLPGPGSVFLEVNWRFVKAVYLNDTITGQVTVESVRADKPICHLLTQVRNQHGEVCLTGTAVTFTVPLKGRS